LTLSISLAIRITHRKVATTRIRAAPPPLHEKEVPLPMPDQRTDDDHDKPGLSETRIDKCVLTAMLSEPSWPWTVDEVGREIQNQVAAADCVARLFRAGLVHRNDEFVWPTRAACHADEIGLGAI